MRSTADPRVGAAVSLVLVVVGAILALVSDGSTAAVAWLLVGVGGLGLLTNVAIYVSARKGRDTRS